MYDKLVIAVSIILFAVATVIIYAWGLSKSMNQAKELNDMLYSKTSRKVIKYLNTNEYITKHQIEEIVDGVKARELFSKKIAAVKDKKEFAKSLISLMMSRKLICCMDKGNQRVYVLNK